MAEHEVSILAENGRPLSWRVECVDSDGDGGCDVTIFFGPNAEGRATKYAKDQYGFSAAPQES